MTLLLCMLSLNENGECLKKLKLLELMENEIPALGLMSYIHIAIRALLVLENLEDEQVPLLSNCVANMYTVKHTLP